MNTLCVTPKEAALISNEGALVVLGKKTLDKWYQSSSKSQLNEEVGQEREQEIRKDTAKKRDKIKVRYSSSNPPVGFKSHGERSNTSQFDEKIIGVEAVVFEGLDEVKSNLIELEELNKEGLTNLELKLIEALSSLHKEFDALKA
ncbi:hypothetical protein KY290_012978 [Solanum tuberosum]|uniref:Uncharacterized protein n=1 Tax=Solanum tuberosum TaxID=4113 RepID=A0ABQ7VKE5_SOLTU|nr:hypothetical protein KY285_012742 [Solanum tuberosum]KAH0768997.1 hypothetical protein KY290_012978 [Solanum tuberosum]